MFKVNKSLEVGPHGTILLLCLAISLRVKGNEELVLYVKEIIE